MDKFSELLEMYLQERDRQNSDYYDGRYIGARIEGRQSMEDAASKMDDMISKLEGAK